MVESKTVSNIKIMCLQSKTESWMILDSGTEENSQKLYFVTPPKGLQDFMIQLKVSKTHNSLCINCYPFLVWGGKKVSAPNGS